MLFLDKRIYKKTYLLLDKGFTVSKIKKKIKQYYNVTINQSDILKWFPNVRKNYNEIPEKTRRTILNLYENWPNTDKVIEYMDLYHDFTISYNNLRLLASRYSVKKKKRSLYAQSKISYKEEKNILKMYNDGVSSKDIANHYGYKTTKSIYDKISKFDIKASQIREDKHYNWKSYGSFSMKEIDSNEKAYFLGLLLTDGSINPERNFVELSLIDEDAISFLANHINCKYNCYKKSKGKDEYRICLYGKDLVEELFRKHVRPVKTHNLQGPPLSEKEITYLPYIMRGIIDGDGWVRSDGKEFFICSASYDFIDWCVNALTLLGMVNLKITSLDSGIKLVRSATKNNILILQQIYSEQFGMERKRKRIKEGRSETIIETPLRRLYSPDYNNLFGLGN